jgi:hypothetical protein
MATLDEHWRKSSRSYRDGECVEVRWAKPFIEVRDTKDIGGPVLRFAPDAWVTFIRTLTDEGPNHAA